VKNGENPMKKYMKWIVLVLILAFTIGIEVYKGEEGRLPWAIIFAAVVVFFVYNFWKDKQNGNKN
jgi:membrane protein YdbS with pleckstrin-like domain